MPFIHGFKARKLDNIDGIVLPEDLAERAFDVLHGHFVADQFDSYVSRPDAFRTVVFRHPLDRMVSHYSYWQRSGGNPTHRVPISFDAMMDFVDFCFMPKLQNYQAQAIGSLDLKDFGAVGTTEHLTSFVNQVLTAFGKEKVAEQPVLKRAPLQQATKLGIGDIVADPGFMRSFESFHSRDMELYAAACQISASN